MACRRAHIHLACLFLALALPALGGVILNPGFENGPTSGPADNWTDTSVNFGYNRCSTASCGTGSGTAGPHSGTYWEWLGGSSLAPETGIVSQTVLIASGGPAALSAFIWYGAASGNAQDVFTVKMDSTTLFTILGSDPTDSGYVLRNFDVSAFADGAGHNIEFRLVSAGGVSMNVGVDDVSLTDASSPIPEPSTWVLATAGLAALAAAARRRGRA